MRLHPLLFVLALLWVTPAAQAATFTAAPDPLTFNQDVSDGTSDIQTAVVTNHTGSAVFPLSVTGPSNPDFQLVADQFGDCSMRVGLFDGESCTVRVRFTPSSGTESITDSVTVDGGSPNTATVHLAGNGTHRVLTPDPTSVPFGSRSIGAGPTAASPVTITNTGTGPVTITGAPSLSGTDASQFQIVSGSGSCPSTGDIQPNTGCTIYVTFDPSSAGGKSAQVTLPSNAPVFQVGLTGTGILAQLARSPDTLTFAQDVDAGPTSQTATITNVGSEPVPIGSVVISGSPDFTQLTGGANDCSPGVNLAIGATCDVRIAFDPTFKGPKSATVTVNSSAPPVSVALNGTATLTALDMPSTVDFGALEVGAGKTVIKSSTVTNTGTQPITVREIRLKDPDTARFLWARGLPGDCAPGRTLAGGETCELRVVYVPQSDGTKVGTMTVTSSLGVSTLLLTAAGTPRLAIPAFSDRASRTQNRRLTVYVTPIGGVVSNLVVRVRSRSGALLGTGTLTRAGSERAVTVRLRSKLRPGRYVAEASGRDSFSDVVTATPREFRLR
ncbi:MAG: trimeric autotransporter adhesin [Thermoleophilaceae bacterium]|nr:trimeric autotransporter adhesin [Thermoleophilaceae bacterium]